MIPLVYSTPKASFARCLTGCGQLWAVNRIRWRLQPEARITPSSKILYSQTYLAVVCGPELRENDLMMRRIMLTSRSVTFISKVSRAPKWVCENAFGECATTCRAHTPKSITKSVAETSHVGGEIGSDHDTPPRSLTDEVIKRKGYHEVPWPPEGTFIGTSSGSLFFHFPWTGLLQASLMADFTFLVEKVTGTRHQTAFAGFVSTTWLIMRKCRGRLWILWYYWEIRNQLWDCTGFGWNFGNMMQDLMQKTW